jgi:quercetin 2,3-dioxygenase
MYAGLFDSDETANLTLPARRKAYVHLVRGQVDINGHTLHAGDAALLESEKALQVAHGKNAELLVFDLTA